MSRQLIKNYIKSVILENDAVRAHELVSRSPVQAWLSTYNSVDDWGSVVVAVIDFLKGRKEKVSGNELKQTLKQQFPTLLVEPRGPIEQLVQKIEQFGPMWYTKVAKNWAEAHSAEKIEKYMSAHEMLKDYETYDDTDQIDVQYGRHGEKGIKHRTSGEKHITRPRDLGKGSLGS